MIQPRVLILRAPGTNCDGELAFAFELAGAAVTSLHIRALRQNPKLLQDFEILSIAGGFSFGDDVAAGKILAVQLAAFFGDAIREFRDQEKLILGVCNGFQALLKAGLLIQPDEDGPLVTLTDNTNGFQDRWITMKVTPGNCPWLQDIDTLEAPTAHGEGNFQCREEWILRGLEESGQVVLHYADSGNGKRETGNGQKQTNNRGAENLRTESDIPFPGSRSPVPDHSKILPFPFNPNGSQGNVAGICDPTGLVLGLMPHPERNVLPTHHPRWTREGLKKEGDGLKLFRNAVGWFA